MFYEVHFTERERTLKRCTLKDVETAIRAVMNGRAWRADALRGIKDTELFTIVELNDLVQRVQYDTDFYG